MQRPREINGRTQNNPELPLQQVGLLHLYNTLNQDVIDTANSSKYDFFRPVLENCVAKLRSTKLFLHMAAVATSV